MVEQTKLKTEQVCVGLWVWYKRSKLINGRIQSVSKDPKWIGLQ